MSNYKKIFFFAIPDILTPIILFLITCRIEEYSYSLLIIYTVFFIISSFLLGFYGNIYKKSRLISLKQTIVAGFIAMIFIFFIYKDILANFILHFTLLYVFISSFLRILFQTTLHNKLKNGDIGIPSIIVADSTEAKNLAKRIKNNNMLLYNKILGFVWEKESLSKKDCLGTIEELDFIIDKYDIQEIIISENNFELIKRIAQKIGIRDINIRIPSLDFFVAESYISFDHPYEVPWILVKTANVNRSYLVIKRVLDIVISLFGLIISSPFLLFLSILIKFDSRGPVIYEQERIGKNEKPFTMYKLRTMFVDAEKNGPALSSDNDNRITRIGKFLRKYRIDEVPQFYNVLKGDMSIVGPRPERRYFIDKVSAKYPDYKKLFWLKPGITSWGMIKFGYASTIEEIIERSKYDLLYLRNISLYTDLKILLLTIGTVLKGKGK